MSSYWIFYYLTGVRFIYFTSQIVNPYAQGRNWCDVMVSIKLLIQTMWCQSFKFLYRKSFSLTLMFRFGLNMCTYYKLCMFTECTKFLLIKVPHIFINILHFLDCMFIFRTLCQLLHFCGFRYTKQKHYWSIKFGLLTVCSIYILNNDLHYKLHCNCKNWKFLTKPKMGWCMVFAS